MSMNTLNEQVVTRDFGAAYWCYHKYTVANTKRINIPHGSEQLQGLIS